MQSHNLVSHNLVSHNLVLWIINCLYAVCNEWHAVFLRVKKHAESMVVG